MWKLCRVCLGVGGVHRVFDDHEDLFGETPHEVILRFLGPDGEIQDVSRKTLAYWKTFPQHICVVCLADLKIFLKLQKRIRSCHKAVIASKAVFAESMPAKENNQPTSKRLPRRWNLNRMSRILKIPKMRRWMRSSRTLKRRMRTSNVISANSVS